MQIGIKKASGISANSLLFNRSSAWTRTRDTLINSQVL